MVPSLTPYDLPFPPKMGVPGVYKYYIGPIGDLSLSTATAAA